MGSPDTSRPSIAAVLGGLLVATFSTACTPEVPRPNILLITIDTLRADRLGCYGAEGDPSPSIDRLAREGLRFANAACPLPTTRPSHFSLLTALYPRQHGVMSNADSLPAEVITLAEVLRGAGYRTGGFTGVKLLAPGSGAERGFDSFEAPAVHDRRAGEVVPPAVEWLASAPEPFFLWVHLYDPHMPYGPPPPFGRPPPPGLDLESFARPDLAGLLEENGGDLPREWLDWALVQYSEEVRYTDLWVGELLRAIEESGALDRTVAALTADHGECFGNGVYFEHGGCLYDGAVRVPLVLRFPPRLAPGVAAAPVELLDVAPTLLALAGVDAPRPFAGRSLLAAAPEGAAAFSEHSPLRESALQRREARREMLTSVAGEPLREPVDHEIAAVRTARWKYIVSPAGAELYDLEADPEETTDLAAERPEVVNDLEGRLRAWMREHPARPPVDGPVDAELEKTLEALGY